jgi:accessory colonization factor AcfC
MWWSAVRLVTVVLAIVATPLNAVAAETLHVYGPGGPLPAMKEAAAAFSKQHSLEVLVTGGPVGNWLENAKRDGDIIYSGSEHMMTDFIKALAEQIDPSTVIALYLRPSAVLVRPGNPKGIRGLKDVAKPGTKILVVQGAGQTGLWEDMAGRTGDINLLRAIRSNIGVYAPDSGKAKEAWISDKSLDAWLIWDIWQVSNPELAETVAVEKEFVIYRDAGIAYTHRGKARPEARQFVEYLQGQEGARIFAKWGWMTSAP